MIWWMSDRADAEVVPLADRHYNRQSIGAPQFVPPGRCLVFKTQPLDAFWVTSWPFAEYVKHHWPGAWINSAFRKEGDDLASEMIRQAISATRYFWMPPEIGLITFVNPKKVRHKRDPGRCYLRAGFHRVGKTKSGLIALQMLPDEMPAAESPHMAQQLMFA
jgi:hypothetical protein